MYPFAKIEKKWREKWEETRIYEPDLDKAKKPFYNLMMFPYPSAEGLHIGSVRTFSGVDVFGRFKRMQGYDVFEPIGLDGFGIHSENFAIKTGKHPMDHAETSEKNFYRQLGYIGNGFSWDEKLETYDPNYYKWTQWVFIKMWEQGLVERKKANLNWCPSCKTVLADEQVINGKCERCGSDVTKKELEQWFFKITDYAEKLLSNLDDLDWTEHIKILQRNWIGKSEGSLLAFSLRGISGQSDDKHSVSVFTTRPDTIFGATFVVISPELAQKWIDIGWSASEKVKQYIRKSLSKTENERIAEQKSKTGVDAGITAVNPATRKEIPVWIADYVLSSYGTGAIMAVPAHDERDHEFAVKNDLEIRTVIEPVFIDSKGQSAVREGEPFIERDAIMAIVKHWKDDKYIGLRWKKVDWETIVTGGVEEEQTPEKAAIEEIREETGYLNPKLVKELPPAHSKFFHNPKGVNRFAHFRSFYFELENGDKEEISSEEKGNHDVLWLTKKEMESFRLPECHRFAWNTLVNGKNVYTGKGLMVNSEKFDGMDSEEAKGAIIKQIGGEKRTDYHLRDWLISRQRYWGPPIPMIYCSSCAKASAGRENAGWQPVPEKDLPVLLPRIDDFRPKGSSEAPLASHPEFYETTCPECKGPARRETDVSDTFLDSAWYFFRYPDTKNGKEAFSKKRVKKWLPVDMYIGGVEHAVLHLLYARFITMALKNMGLVDFEEPFTRLRPNGLITFRGSKMSKSKGNIIDPDDYIGKFGADAIRIYLQFISPLYEGGDWQDGGLIGAVRFLDRVWKLGENVDEPEDVKEVSSWMHKSIKRITDSISELKYNSAIAELMTILNKFEDGGEVNRKDLETFLLMLAPLAPFITEELWEKLGNKYSIHVEAWPKYDEKKLVEDTISLIVQVNGKLRATIETTRGINEKRAEELALSEESVKRYVTGKPKRVIFVKDKLINFVV